ncbi:MAG: hypothetical protein QOE98_1590 [Gaiellaceae bacterium]|nr:hypothetical protein [Gaiellaceae bacterium]
MAAVLIVAFAARFGLVASWAILSDRFLIPDEGQYVALATAVSAGTSPDEWYPGYGQSLYDSTWVFSAPLSLLFDVFGPSRIMGALITVLVGTTAAGVTTAIGVRFLRPAFAVLAGLVVALSPSQILFSSVVLREAHVWLALTLVGFGAVLLAHTDRRRMAGGLTLVALGLLAVAYLRPQTLLIAAWALSLAMILTPWRGWIPRVAATLAVVAIVPWTVGLGVGGYQLASAALPRLGNTRATLAVGANSAFTDPGSPGSGDTDQAGAPAIVSRVEADKSITSGFSNFPEGVLNVTMRPYPWEPTPSMSLTLARVDNLEWYVLYALCAIGIVVSIRRRAARLALQFPMLLVAMMIATAAVTQGNLGTAYRHREQILWALALGAAAGAQWLWSRWAAAPAERAAEPSRAEPVATGA